MTNDELRQLAGQASGLPWRKPHFADCLRSTDNKPLGTVFDGTNAEYIVAACNALPGLLDRIATLTAELSAEQAHTATLNDMAHALATQCGTLTAKCTAMERVVEVLPRAERYTRASGNLDLCRMIEDALYALDVASRDGVDPGGEGPTPKDKET